MRHRHGRVPRGTRPCCYGKMARMPEQGDYKSCVAVSRRGYVVRIVSPIGQEAGPAQNRRGSSPAHAQREEAPHSVRGFFPFLVGVNGLEPLTSCV